MKYFFPQVDDLPVDNSPISADGYFRSANVTGLIEQQFNDDQTVVRIFVSGAPCMAYALGKGENRSIPLAEFSILNNETSHLRAIKLPDVAGRLTWLALESQASNKYSIEGDSAWETQLNQWKQVQWNGLIEIAAKTIYGFALFWQGELQKTDIIFSTPQGFITDLPRMENADDSFWEITTYSHKPSAQAYQCASLRRGAIRWSHQILSRYREMVGQKLLQTMDRELNRQIRPWRWNILLDENDLLDVHFFPYLMDAAHAYRALFMAMGAQMNFVIGNNLTQRLLSETFGQIHPDERSILQSQRLIPAAFSE
jgi:hypothetical protein